ncbi:gp53-like domain-containing protein [Citrobacter portucalensis]|uniref:gp53-like domain-containing protein n=1 Tax=Citrobacter portucalensis TaxID=1639133 RepID=UPI0040346378
MSENNYGALMIKSALDNSVDIKTVSAPGIYSVIAGNGSVPNSLAATLQVLPPVASPKLYLATADGNAYHLTAPGWQVYGDIKTINGEKPDANGAITIDADDVGAVSASGGNYNADFKFKSVGTIPTEQNGVSLVTPTTTSPNDFANWMQSDWYDDKVLWGILRGGSDKATGAGIQVMGLLFSFLADGTMKSGNETVAFQNWVTNNYLKKTAVGSAAGRDVGTGTNQIPDMNSFQSGSNANGIWFRLPSGILIQFGMLPATNPTSYSAITFPTPFTETPAYTLSVTSATPVMVVAVGANITGIAGIQTFNLAGNQLDNGVPWIAIGR